MHISLFTPTLIENIQCLANHSFVRKLLGSKIVPLFGVSYIFGSTSRFSSKFEFMFWHLAF